MKFQLLNTFNVKFPALCLMIFTVAACASQKSVALKSASRIFSGGKWILLEISGTAVDPSKAGKELPYMDFDMIEKRMSVFAGCNRMSASFAVSNDTLVFAQLISTRMACPDMEYEYALQRLLVPGNYTYVENGNVLQLFYNSDKVLGLKRHIKE